jgi:alpha-amylase
MKLALVFHNHQPVGQLPWAFEDAWRDSYAPFLDELEKHPGVRVALHYTGPLLDWMTDYRPDTIERVRDFVARGQVEVLAGGYYEPILAIWPREDQIAQLEMLRDRVKSLFGSQPQGMWLAERVWEPQLPDPIAAAQLGYTFVDSTVFEAAEVSEAAQHGFYTARHDGSKVQVFPINQTLRHRIPWEPVENAIDYLRAVHKEAGADAIAVFADDGEKFGAWPGTFDYIFTKGWLETFFTEIEANADWLQTVTPREYLQQHPSLGEVSLAAGSYSEMQEWSGGNWRNFLERYSESRDLYEEVMRTRNELTGGNPPNARPRNIASYDCILRAQSNDAYWHGVFGGLYLRHLRQAVYEWTARARAGYEPIKIDDNGLAFASLRNQRIGVKAQGGQIFQWISTSAKHNLLSTLRRYPESYHRADGQESIVDWYPRGAAIDHFFGDDVTPESFSAASFSEEGDFVSEPWQIQSGENSKKCVLELKRDGGVWHAGTHHPLTIAKTFTLSRGTDEVKVRYVLENKGSETLNLWWANEWNIAVSGAELPERHYHADNHKKRLSLEKLATFDSVINPIVGDRWLQLWLEWKFNDSPALWHVPIETISQKEGGEIERTHQSSAFVFLRRVTLAAGATQAFDFSVTLTAKDR